MRICRKVYGVYQPKRAGREYGIRNFQNEIFDVPEIMTQHANDKRKEFIPNLIHAECRYNGYSTESNIIAEMSQEEYFAMWDRIDKRGLFQNGYYTGTSLDSYLPSNLIADIKELVKARKEEIQIARDYEYKIKEEKKLRRKAKTQEEKNIISENIKRLSDDFYYIIEYTKRYNDETENKIRNIICHDREFYRVYNFFT